MSYFLSPQELKDALISAEEKSVSVFEPFDEYERIARNELRDDHPRNYPKITDGTTSAQLLENAKRVFGDLYPGKFTSIDRNEEWLRELVNILWNRVIIPGANTDADFYMKMWNMHYRVEQHGASHAFCFFNVRDGYKGADFTLDYVKDVLPEPGKLSFESSNYLWRYSYMTAFDLKALINAVEREEKRAKKEKRDSFSTWDLGALKEYSNRGPEGKKSTNMSRNDRLKQMCATHYVFATCYHKGYNAPFYTIIPALDGRIARTRYNENPTGATPIATMYHTQDLMSPTGKGLVEVARSGQNVLDYFTSADVLATQIGLEPPMQVKGNVGDNGFKPKTIQVAPRAMWYVGNTSVDPVNFNTDVYSMLQSRLGTYKSNVLNQLGSFDDSVSAESGNPQFSKTAQGVESLNSRSTVNDNFFSKAGVIGYSKVADNLMNIHLANMEGRETFELLKDEVERLQKAGWELGGNTNAILVYEHMRGKFHFEAEDPRNIDDPEKDGLKEILQDLPDAKDAIEQNGTYRVDLGEAYRQYFSKLKIPNIDKIIIPINPDAASEEGAADAENQQGNPQAVQQPGTGQADAAMQIPQAQGAVRAPSGSINYKDAPPDIQAQMEAADGYTPSVTHSADLHSLMNPPAQPAPVPVPVPGVQSQNEAPVATQQQSSSPQIQEDPAKLAEELDQTMTAYGLDRSTAASVMALRRAGIPEEEIAAQLIGGDQNVVQR